MLTPAFHFNILRNFMAIFIEESAKVVKQVNLRIDSGNPIQDVCLLSCGFTMPTICESAMGVKIDGMKEADEYRDNLLVLVQNFARRLTHSYLHPDILFKLLGFERTEKKLLKPIHNFSKVVIEKRRQMFYENQASIEDLQNENMWEKLPLILSNDLARSVLPFQLRDQEEAVRHAGHVVVQRNKRLH